MSAYTSGAVFPRMSGFSFMPMPENSKTQNRINASEKPLEEDRSKASSPTFDFSSKSEYISPPTTEYISNKNNCEDKKTEFQSEVDILVREAKIDPVRLVQSLTSPKKKRRKQNFLVSKSMQDLNDKHRNANDDDDDNGDPHRDAIEFELSIAFNGRTYTAKRTLSSVIQLRNDIIMEMKNRSRKLHLREMRWPKSPKKYRRETHVDHHHVNAIELLKDNNDENRSDQFNGTIPKVPNYYPEENMFGGQLVSCGFTALQALLLRYCPVMEGWLRQIIDLVAPIDSPSLSNFLWEPLHGSTLSSPLEAGKKNGPSLRSITEDESNDDL